MKASPSSDSSPDPSTTWSIGELASRLGLATHVLRHWEEVGLLAPRRDGSGYRRYSRDDLVRVLTIRSSQAAGMSLEQVGTLLDVDSAARHAVLEAHLAQLEEQRRELERSRLMTEHALRCQAHDVARCPRFASYVQDLVEGVAHPDATVTGLPAVPVVPVRRP